MKLADATGTTAANSSLFRDLSAGVDRLVGRKTLPKPTGRALEILNIASDLLREGGFEAFSMRRVAERSNLTLAALQYYFPTRAALITGMIELRLRWYGEALRDLLAGLDANDPTAAFLSVVDWLLDDARYEPSASFTVQFWAFAAYNGEANAMLDRFMLEYRAFLCVLMRRVNPNLSEPEAMTRAAAISAMIDGTLLLVAPGKPFHPEYRDLQATVRSIALHMALA